MAPPNYQCFVLNATCESWNSIKKMEKADVLSYDGIRWQYIYAVFFVFHDGHHASLNKESAAMFWSREWHHYRLDTNQSSITTDPLWGSRSKKWTMYPRCLILFALCCFHKGQSVDCLFRESVRKVVYTLKSITHFVNQKQTNVLLLGTQLSYW